MADEHEAVNQDPESVDFARMAQKFVQKEDFDRAISLLTEGIRSHPAYATGYLMLGTIHAQRGEQEKTTEFLEKALVLDPQNPRLLFMLGQQYLTSSPDRAQELLWKARRYEPEHKQLAEVFHKALEVTESTGESVETVFIGHEEPSEIPIPQEDEIAPDETVQDEEETVLIEVESPPETPVDQEEEELAEETGEPVDLPVSEPEGEWEPEPESVEKREPEPETAGSIGEEAVDIEQKEAEEVPETGETEERIDVEPEEKREPPGDVEVTEPSDVTEPEDIAEPALVTPFEEAVPDEDISIDTIQDFYEQLEQPPGPASDVESSAEPPEADATDEAIDDILSVIEDETDYIGALEQSSVKEEIQTAPEETPPAVDDVSAESVESPEDIVPESETTSGEAALQPDEYDLEEGEEEEVEQLEDYSKLLENNDFSSIETAEGTAEGGILEFGEEELSSLRFDESTPEAIEEPLISDEERAELSAIEETGTVGESPEPGEESVEETELTGEREDELLLSEMADELVGEEAGPTDITAPETWVDEGTAGDATENVDYADLLYGDITAGEEKVVDTDGKGEPAADYEEITQAEYPVGGESPGEPVGEEKEKPDQMEMPAAAAGESGDAPVVGGEESVFTLSRSSGDDSELEDIIRDSMSPEELDSLEHTPLEILIDDYSALLDNPHGDISETDDIESPPPDDSSGETPPIEIADDDRVDTRDTGSDDFPDFPLEQEETTATMAEIFVKQGMLSRAITIYTGLAGKQPENETLRRRLEELKNMRTNTHGAQ